MTQNISSNICFLLSEFNYSFKWVDDQKYGKRNQETGEWNGMMGELLAQVGQSDKTHNTVTLQKKMTFL